MSNAPLHIGILGATGKAGSDLTREALRRDHRVTAVVRDADRVGELGDPQIIERDVFDLRAEDLTGLDVVVNAVGFTPDQAHRHLTLSEHLISLARELGTEAPRLIFILGAGSLTGPKGLFLKEIRQVPGAEHWIAIPENQLKQLEYLRSIDDVEWTGVSPQAEFAPGPATAPKLGRDEILPAADGTSRTSTGTMAVAVLDEIETPAHRGVRFTVSDA